MVIWAPRCYSGYDSYKKSCWSMGISHLNPLKCYQNQQGLTHVSKDEMKPFKTQEREELNANYWFRAGGSNMLIVCWMKYQLFVACGWCVWKETLNKLDTYHLVRGHLAPFLQPPVAKACNIRRRRLCGKGAVLGCPRQCCKWPTEPLDPIEWWNPPRPVPKM